MMIALPNDWWKGVVAPEVYVAWNHLCKHMREAQLKPNYKQITYMLPDSDLYRLIRVTTEYLDWKNPNEIVWWVYRDPKGLFVADIFVGGECCGILPLDMPEDL